MIPEDASTDQGVEFADDEDAADYAGLNQNEFSDAVLWGTDWTVETLLTQIARKSIEISPQFQRRDAWSRPAKSKFIESIILGLPIPQIVLAERKEKRGSYLILDGKQRLLSLAQYAGILSDSENNAFGLSGLEILTNLKRQKYRAMAGNPAFEPYLSSFHSHTIRAIVIRNWPNVSFLHLVFQRLNTGSLKLSPQELRQAVTPGPFLDFADSVALKSDLLHALLGLKAADSRMRDTELLVRYISFQLRLSNYRGRMKDFIDESCAYFNTNWLEYADNIEVVCKNFEGSISLLFDVFGENLVSRRKGSPQFNRSIFDALSYYTSQAGVPELMREHREAVKIAYNNVTEDLDFQAAVESDTAGLPHTYDRLRIWGIALGTAIGKPVKVPTAVKDGENFVKIEP